MPRRASSRTWTKPVQFLTPLPEPEPTKFCKDCKHYLGPRDGKCNKPEFADGVNLVTGELSFDYAGVLRLKYQKCGIEARGWEPRV